MVDYPHRTRLKLLGHARIVSTDEKQILAELDNPGYRARVEGALVITVAAFDWNCPQHIAQRYTRSEMESVIGPLTSRIAELELQLKECRSQDR